MQRRLSTPAFLALAVALNAPVRAGEPGILTPPPAAEPRINGPRVYGVRPGHP